MKPVVAFLIFAAAGGAAWFGGNQYATDHRATIARQQVSEAELRATLDKASAKARQVLSYTTTPVVGYGEERERARKVTAADFNGERFTEEQIQRSIEALPGLLNDGLEEMKLTGATAYQSSGRIEISELRGPIPAVLGFMKRNEDIKELRFATVVWEVHDTTPVLHLEYDIWKPDASVAPSPAPTSPAANATKPSRTRQ